MSDEDEQPIWDHLEELVVRLRRILFAVAIATALFAALPTDFSAVLRLDFSSYQPLVAKIMEAIQVSLLPEGVNLIAFNWLDTFYIYVMISAALGVLVTLPFTAREIYRFIVPALYLKERRYAGYFIGVFVLLFSVGLVYAYFLLLPTTFSVLYRFVYQTRVIPFYSVKDFFNIVAVGLLGSGMFYTFPIVIYMLVKADLILVQTLKESRKQALVFIAVLTAIVTPDPTPLSMLLMTVPFYLLYEITIQVLQRTMGKAADEAVEKGLKASRKLLENSKQVKAEEEPLVTGSD